VSAASPGDIRTMLAAEFEARGWEYDLVTGKAIVERAEEDGRIDPLVLARVVPNGFLQRNGVTRDEVAAAIERAVGNRTPEPSEASPTTVLNVDGRHYSLHVESGGQITGSQVNVGGAQINIQSGVGKEEILAGVDALLRAGLGGDWNPEAARELGAAIDARDDIRFEDVEAVAVEIAETASEPPDEGRVRGMLRSITEQGLGGALGTGISAGLGWLLRNPPV